MRRVALGIIAFSLFGGGLALYLSGAETVFWSAVMMRSGAVLIVLWLAYHQVLQLFQIVPPWMIVAALAGVGAVIAYPKSLLVVLCLLGALVGLHAVGRYLKPRPVKKVARRAKDSSS
jgi:energy-converting hydrogenase Eha subunit F